MNAALQKYVVLHHEEIDAPHFDLMIESPTKDSLLTWRAPCWPILQRTPLTRLVNHRVAYLNYEGPVSGNRGCVSRVAAGHCQTSNGQFSIENVVVAKTPDGWLAIPAVSLKK